MVKLLDCTLRDGGYVNDWNFGSDTIDYVLNNLIESNVDIIETGFIRDEEQDVNRTVFGDVNKLQERIEVLPKKKLAHQKIAVMSEISRPIPVEKIACHSTNDVDIVRVIVWKTKTLQSGEVVDALQESFEYCRAISAKGYKVCVQPNRTDQYSDVEFESMLRLFMQINPLAIYVVDSWGTMYSDQVIHYIDIADKVLPKDISIGFHGHNNMMQAFSTAEKIIENNYEREIIIDASVDGIGRGAGNLNLEHIAQYLNYRCGTSYNLDAIYRIYSYAIKKIKDEYYWGSNMAYFVSAKNNANPDYAAYFNGKIGIEKMEQIYSLMSDNERIIFKKERAESFLIENGDV